MNIQALNKEEADKLSDEEIARKIQEGETNLFEVLVSRYEKKLFRYAKKFLFFEQDAQDLIQDIFLKAYKNFNSFNLKKNFSPWLYRITHNEFINAIKKRKKLEFFSFDLDTFMPYLFSKDEADSSVKNKEKKELIDNCLQNLKPKYREVVVLYFYEELSYKEIADIIRIPISTVGIRLKRARAKIKECLR